MRSQQTTSGSVCEWCAEPEAGGLGGQAAMRRRVGMLAGAVWPPEGSRAVDVEGLYDHLAGLGLDYGPAFQGLGGRLATRGMRCSPRSPCPRMHHDQAGAYGVHPALLDAALHTIALSELRGSCRRAR